MQRKNDFLCKNVNTQSRLLRNFTTRLQAYSLEYKLVILGRIRLR